MEAYSILMSVYHREDPAFFNQAIASMLNQSVVTNDFVIVCDGPLTDELDKVLDQYDRANPGIFQILRLPENVGIGAAANIGLKECKNDLVAKMDADDLSLPGRCEMQLKLFALADTAGQTDKAVAALQSAVRYAHIADDTQADPRAFAFLSPTKSPELMTSQPDCMQMIRMIADYAQNPAYRQVLDDQK